ncbi:MAG TPA: hypothetical protein ENO08_03780, partial [Candidatus Eisenbacteria bacterium]|nr:hypothetical protein [Candidatus Eisenbacteria bacterium]
MLTPERMHQINVLVFETEVDSVAKAIVRLGMLHLVQLDDQEPWAESLKKYDAGQARTKIDGMRLRVSSLMKDLGVRALPLEPRDDQLVEMSLSDLDEMDREISSLESTVESLLARRKELEIRRERLQGILGEVSPLAALGMPSEGAPYSFLEIHYGQVAVENLEYIRDKISPLAAVALDLEHRNKDVVMLLIGLKTDRLKIKRILREAAFNEIEVPEEAKKGTGEVTGELAKKIEEIEDQIAEVDREMTR